MNILERRKEHPIKPGDLAVWRRAASSVLAASAAALLALFVVVVAFSQGFPGH